MSSPSKEKCVTVGGTTEAEAKRVVKGLNELNVRDAQVPEFKTISRYSFKAEWDIIADDIVIHFFLPKQARPKAPREEEAWMKYWLTRFPEKLDSVAQSYFDAEYPRLQAKYTDEVASWWLKAQGYGHMIDPQKYIEGFIDRLDEALREKPEGGN